MNQIVAPNYIATLNTGLHCAAVWDQEGKKTFYIVIIVISLLICFTNAPEV